MPTIKVIIIIEMDWLSIKEELSEPPWPRYANYSLPVCFLEF